MSKSIKEKIRYWYYFLNLVHDLDYEELNRNLKKPDVKKLYKRFGNYRTETFEVWWKNNSHSFKDMSESVKILSEGDKVQNVKDHLVIKIPYRYTPKRANAIFKNIYQRGFNDYHGEIKKLRNVKYKSEISLTTATDYAEDTYQVDQFRYYWTFAKFVYAKYNHTKFNNTDKKLREWSEYATEVFTKKFTKRKEKLKKKADKSIWDKKRSPPFLNIIQYDSQLMQIKRYRKVTENILTNVSNGEFPGDYKIKRYAKNSTTKIKVFR